MILESFINELTHILQDSENMLRRLLDDRNYYNCYFACLEVCRQLNIAHREIRINGNRQLANRLLSKHLNKGTRLKNALQNLINCSPD